MGSVLLGRAHRDRAGSRPARPGPATSGQASSAEVGHRPPSRRGAPGPACRPGSRGGPGTRAGRRRPRRSRPDRPRWVDRGPPGRRSGPAGGSGDRRPRGGGSTRVRGRRAGPGRPGLEPAASDRLWAVEPGAHRDRHVGAASAPAREARRSRTPAPSTEHTAGSGTRSRSRQPPSSRRSADQAVTTGLRAPVTPARAPGPRPARGPGTPGSAPVPRSTDRSPHSTSAGRPTGPDGGHQLGGPAPARRRPARGSPSASPASEAGDPHHRCAPRAATSRSTGSTDAGPTATATTRPDQVSADAQGVLEGGGVGRRRARRPSGHARPPRSGDRPRVAGR